jgi:NADPH:quinone reductase-like Zn-dependent oxidoreductase
MHAWLCENPVGVDALTWQELPTPQPAKGQVLIRIQAASLNFPDLLIVQNKYQMKPELPFVPGSEYAGVIEAVGEGVTELNVGQAVACLSGTGGFATHTLAPAKLCMPLPPGFPPADAAAFIMIYATSHHALLDRGQLKAGETVLVLGAAGGVGMSAIQIAKIAGARVIAAASTDDKCAFCKQLGADETINYSTQDLRERLKELTAWQGPRRDLRPGGRRLHRAGLPLHRLARAPPGGRLCSGRHPGHQDQPGAGQGRQHRGRVLGRLRAPRAGCQRRHDAAAGRLVRTGQDQAHDRPPDADERAEGRLCPHGLAPGSGQAGAGQRLSPDPAGPPAGLTV